MKITDIKLKIITNSKREDTLEAELTSNNLTVSASVPSGESKGSTEVFSIPPKEAVGKIKWIFSQMKDQEFVTLNQFDNFLISLDGTTNKRSLGGNLILSLSTAFTKLLARKGGLEVFELISKLSGQKPCLPRCLFNLIEGGLHVDPENRGLPFQEYLYIPQTSSPKKSLEQALLLVKVLREKIKISFGKLCYGDEGGCIIPPRSALDTLSDESSLGLKFLQQANMETGGNSGKLGIDVAASVLYSDGWYQLGDKRMSRDELLSYYQLLTTNYPLLYIEDPFSQDDLEGFNNLTEELGDQIWITGDDLTTTNIQRIRYAHEKEAVNAVIIKPNQIGTLSETIQAVLLARSYRWRVIVSHRAGETMDTFIADLAVGLGADGFKAGCPLQKERLAKYDRLIKIESNI